MLTSKFYFTFLCSSITIQINFPVRFGTIYLCGAFWKAPMTGTDSKVSNYQLHVNVCARYELILVAFTGRDARP